MVASIVMIGKTGALDFTIAVASISYPVIWAAVGV